MADLQADIIQHNQERRELVNELAAKHKFKAKLVKQRLTASTVFKKSRKPSLFRAKLHHLSKVLNEGLSKNERLSLHDIRKRAIDYPGFGNMSREFKAELLKDLEENRWTKKTGTRASNKAVAQDASHVIKKMDEEIRNLFERCGMYGIAIFSKGHIQDKTIPYILESASASDFIRECLKIDPMDLVVRFEQWCCSRELGFTGVDTLQSMRKEITRMIKEGLRVACKKTKCAMNYERYIKVIILGYGVIIVGWPKSVDFISPTNISSVDDMRKLRDAWRDGACHWKILSAREKEKWRKDYEEQVKSGEIVEVERQRRSDKGVIRGQNVRTVGKRKAGERSTGKSKAAVEDDEEDEDEDEDEGNNSESEEEEPRRKKTSTMSRKTSGKAGSAPALSRKAGFAPALSTKSGPSKTRGKKAKQSSDESEEEEEEEEEEPVKRKSKKSSQSRSGSKKDDWWKEALKKSDKQKKMARLDWERKASKGVGENFGEKRKRREGEETSAGSLKRPRLEDGSSKRRREEDDEDVDEPPAKKSKDSDGRPKPKPKWRGASTTSCPTLRTSMTMDNPSSPPGQPSGASSGSGSAAATGNAGGNISKVRATVKGKAGRGPPGIRNPNPTLMS
ncbi:hypothetical protein C8R45DRAFT_1109620 [Mycena sanguinolenta]|nr:hypothetical protein C8R45DRAFT_1109620 [Mycena sanguinolenta]